MDPHFAPKRALEKNRDALESRNPGLAAALLGEGCDFSAWEVCRAESGRPTARRFSENGLSRWIHSPIDPEREARAWASLQDDDGEAAVLMGMGFGYPLRVLLEKTRQRHILVVEADREILSLALHHADLHDVLDSQQVSLVAGRDEAAFRRALGRMRPGPVCCFDFPPVTSFRRADYDRLKEIFDDSLQRRRMEEEPQMGRALGLLLEELAR